MAQFTKGKPLIHKLDPARLSGCVPRLVIVPPFAARLSLTADLPVTANLSNFAVLTQLVNLHLRSVDPAINFRCHELILDDY
jgi:hypothetical protein